MQQLTVFKAQVQDQPISLLSTDVFFPFPLFPDGKIHDKHHYISRSNYPPGGYLKVSQEHFHQLSELDVFPRYKPRKPHHDKKQRYKRDHASSSYNNIPYCCFNQCEEEFFC